VAGPLVLWPAKKHWQLDNPALRGDWGCFANEVALFKTVRSTSAGAHCLEDHQYRLGGVGLYRQRKSSSEARLPGLSNRGSRRNVGGLSVLLRARAGRRKSLHRRSESHSSPSQLLRSGGGLSTPLLVGVAVHSPYGAGRRKAVTAMLSS
jgi:hypothetical protein